MPLERLLLYTDKEHFDEFPLSEVAHDELYQLFITTKDNVLKRHHKAAHFFNEVFYFITRIYADPQSPENLREYIEGESALYPFHPKADMSGDTLKLKKETQKHKEQVEAANYYVLEFVWFILKKQEQLPKHVQFFLTALDKELDELFFSDLDVPFSTFTDFFENHPTKYNISFEPKPKFDFDIIMAAHQEWQKATLDFDRVKVLTIVFRFEELADKYKIIGEIEEALQITQNEPDIYREISKVTFGKKANKNWLEKLREELKKMPVAVPDKQTLPQDTVIHEGFETYIIKDHKKVMDILMLVANMGKSQLALFIKFVKAFRQLGYIRSDCFDDLQRFRADTRNRFPLSIDSANLKKYIAEGTRVSDTEYNETVNSIATYLQPLL